MRSRSTATEIGLNLHPNARVYVLPCIAGHVGADAAGMVLAERPDLGAELTLLVDVGTNAEIVLGNNHRMLACSSPTGPAFEGAQISCGQRAAPGAIERVRIDPDTLETRFKVIGSDLWSDETGFAESDIPQWRHRSLRVGHHRSDRRDVPGRHHQPGRRSRWATHRTQRPHRAYRAHLRLCRTSWDGDINGHSERRKGDPAGEGGLVRWYQVTLWTILVSTMSTAYDSRGHSAVISM